MDWEREINRHISQGTTLIIIIGEVRVDSKRVIIIYGFLVGLLL